MSRTMPSTPGYPAQKSATFDNTLTGQFNGDASAVAQADKTRLVAIAQAEKTFASSSAGAMKQYQIDVASGTAGAVHTRDVSQADAQLQLATAVADADLAWTQTTAAADETLAYQYADDVRNLRKDLATLARDRKLGESSDWAVLDAALTSADNDEETAGAAAGADQMAADGSADAEFLSSQYDDAVPVTQVFATQFGSPWAQFRADLAGARQTWFSGDPNNPSNPGQREEYAGLGSDTGAFQNSLAGSMANIRDALAQALRGAETSFTGTEAGADLSWTQDVADAEADWLEDAATATKDYTIAMAQAAHDHAIASAQAARDFVASGDGVANAVDVSAANAALAADQQAAAHDYRVAIVAAAGTRATAIALASQTYDHTVSAAWESLVQTESAAERQAAIDSALADETFLNNLTSRVGSHLTSDSQTYASAINNLAGTNGTAWAVREADMADAESDRTTAIAGAYVNLKSSTSAADRQQQEHVAQAREARANSVAAAEGDYTRDTADAMYDHVVDSATTANQRAALDIAPVYLPVVAVAPNVAGTLREPSAYLKESAFSTRDAGVRITSRAGSMFTTGASEGIDVTDFYDYVSPVAPLVYTAPNGGTSIGFIGCGLQLSTSPDELRDGLTRESGGAYDLSESLTPFGGNWFVGPNRPNGQAPSGGPSSWLLPGNAPPPVINQVFAQNGGGSSGSGQGSGSSGGGGSSAGGTTVNINSNGQTPNGTISIAQPEYAPEEIQDWIRYQNEMAGRRKMAEDFHRLMGVPYPLGAQVESVPVLVVVIVVPKEGQLLGPDGLPIDLTTPSDGQLLGPDGLPINLTEEWDLESFSDADIKVFEKAYHGTLRNRAKEIPLVYSPIRPIDAEEGTHWWNDSWWDILNPFAKSAELGDFWARLSNDWNNPIEERWNRQRVETFVHRVSLGDDLDARDLRYYHPFGRVTADAMLGMRQAATRAVETADHVGTSLALAYAGGSVVRVVPSLGRTGFGILGRLKIVRPSKNVDPAMKDYFLKLLHSPHFAENLEAYNAMATRLGLTEAASLAEIEAALQNETTFARTGQNYIAALFVEGEHSYATRFLLQATNSQMRFLGPTAASRIGSHELLHLGAALRGQTNTVLHEFAVSLASTPELFVAKATAGTVIAGAVAYEIYMVGDIIVIRIRN